MIAISVLAMTIVIMILLGTVMFPNLYRRSWLKCLEKKRQEIKEEIETMNKNLDVSEAFADFERVNFDLTMRANGRGTNWKHVWEDYDTFQKSLDLHRSDLLGARINRSIEGNGNIERLLKARVIEVRKKVLETLGDYMDEFEDDKVDDLLINPVDLYTHWSERMGRLENHKAQGLVKLILKHAKIYDAHLEGLVESANAVREAKRKLVLVDQYIKEFYDDQTTYRPVSNEKRDQTAELLMNAGWAWRLHDNAGAMEMAERVMIDCDNFLEGLRISFGELLN